MTLSIFVSQCARLTLSMLASWHCARQMSSCQSPSTGCGKQFLSQTVICLWQAGAGAGPSAAGSRMMHKEGGLQIGHEERAEAGAVMGPSPRAGAEAEAA